MTRTSRSKTNRDLALEVQSKLILCELERKHWTQSALAKATDLPLYTINRVTRGKVLASHDVAHRIAEALQIDLAAITQPERRSCPREWAEGIQEEALDNGKVKIRVNAEVERGVELAIKALVHYEAPITTARLAMLLKALYEPITKPNA